MGSTLSGEDAGGQCVGVDVSVAGATQVNNGWWASQQLKGKLYCIPCSAERLLIYDPGSGGVEDVDTRRIATGDGKWRASTSIDGKIYGIPDRAEHLLVFDTSTKRASGVPISNIGKGFFKWQSAHVLGGKVYALPCHADQILVYDPASGQAKGIPADDPRKPGPSKWLSGGTLRGRLYGVPANASAILVYDPATKRISFVDIQGIATGDMKWLASVILNGKLYAVPCHAECILVFDPATSKCSSVSTSHIAVGPGKWSSAVVLGEKIYGIPDHADVLLIFDPVAGTVSGVDTSGIASGPFKWQAATTRGGKLYALPYNSEQILVYDTATKLATGVSSSCVSSGAGKWGTLAQIGGRICGVPFDAKQLLVFRPNEGVAPVDDDTTEVDLPANAPVELLHHFAAAWLSRWIYSVVDTTAPAAVPSLTVGGAAVEFDVHWVHDEPMSGSPARLATVTATFPGGIGKVFFLPFKGSSFLSDFVVNASTLPDYSPFDRAFGDRSSFVHHGAYNAIAQLRIHKRDDLWAQLRVAESSGVQHFIVTGHSLGGQYALAFLVDAFLDLRRGPSTEGGEAARDFAPGLLKNLQTVVFGSPMCFGAAEGAEPRKDFRTFIQERSIIYMTMGDPAPRLWSELDVEEFLKYFARTCQNKMSSVSARFVDWVAGPGGIEKRIEELLQRQDIESHLLRPASCYRHFSKIRLLSTDDFRDWRPLGQDDICMEDHSLISTYIPALRSTIDPLAPGGYCLYEEDGRLVLT
eukprot:TRINITY_DN62403_c0_g1_i1.p1 TRINITY_DN62403_c0_g1~~TRINITY_DN62403_c0_g1_i1.p1  ORF type:complete len:753 (+),score=83.75 TRINITY_DN62403_c0_g1_i1:81-2339(+)